MQDEAVAVLARLVSFDTTSRNSNLALLQWVGSWLAARGVESRILPDDSGMKANLHALVGPRVPGGVALSAHVDCVPVEGQAWLADPFTLRQEDGRLIGRGTSDMKGFAACAIAMLPRLAALPLRRPVHLCLTHDEETTGEGARRLVPMLGQDQPPPALCVVGEPTGLAPVIAQKGYASWDVTVTGLSGHSSRTTETANALHAAAEGVAWLSARARALAESGRRVEGFEPPWTTVHVGTFRSGSILNIVPDRAEFTFEVRSVPGDDPGAILADFHAFMEGTVLPRLRAVAPEARLEVAVRSAMPGFDLPEDAPLALTMQRLTGRNRPGRVSYGTEAGFFQAAGIATIVCGPGHIAQAHQPEEWIAESEIAACLDLLDRLAGTLTEA
ncbi:acetylornithine deacetylase [Paracraurococcus ruber]|uniref:Acetylornithine deacetylase n=1 Tax=Paracraurococcus ruber TaxID=77675 RepID=A0ABS1CU52_9PROT|nr:acetylornithine deacetylase [Paracraurococcus ruber]MBK1658016.1 acetylornithine deacetylase [Paracraurococcus ruber]TDG33822.1 acetylornithine deacetylase [Paracraurococcus ruber]